MQGIRSVKYANGKRYEYIRHATSAAVESYDRQERERMKEQCRKASESIPADAFADDVIDDDVGVYYSKPTDVIGLSTLGLHSTEN